jgi:hypothetical protein
LYRHGFRCQKVSSIRWASTQFFMLSYKIFLLGALAGLRRNGKGVASKTPLHTLRKQFGSEIHARYGLLAASEQLRHGGIAVTARHYMA